MTNLDHILSLIRHRAKLRSQEDGSLMPLTEDFYRDAVEACNKPTNKKSSAFSKNTVAEMEAQQRDRPKRRSRINILSPCRSRCAETCWHLRSCTQDSPYLLTVSCREIGKRDHHYHPIEG